MTPDWLREHRRYKELRQKLAALEGDYTSQFEKAHSKFERDQLTGKWDFEEAYLEAEIGKIKTNKIVRRAKRHCIVLSPETTEQGWWTDYHQEEPFLNNSGLNQAKLLIQDRFRQSMKWLGWVIATIVGMAIGIRSLLVE